MNLFRGMIMVKKYDKLNAQDAQKLKDKIAELETKNREANIFIKWIAELLNMETDGVGFDEIKWDIDDFQKAIEKLKEEE